MSVLSNSEIELIMESGREAASKGLAIVSCPYNEVSEQRDLWRSGWKEYAEYVQGTKDISLV